MGLDWLAGNKAKPGYEERFDELIGRVVAGDKLTESEVEEWHELGIPSYACVGAPRVGEDPEADRFVVAFHRQSTMDEEGQADPEAAVDLDELTEEERSILEDAEGIYVLQLAPACDGLPIYSNAAAFDELELTSFRGAFLTDCVEVIGEELLEAAYERKTPAGTAAYGRELLEKARAFAEEHGCEQVLEQREPPEDLDTPAGRAHIVASAGRWCVYWGDRGHFLDPWF